jgi:aminopeptidase N
MPENTGPIEWGQRLIDLGGQDAWRIVTYDKGTWIQHMLQERMGRDAYRRMLRQIARDFLNKPISNDEFRQIAAKFLPPGEADPSLELFFDTWVYGTGVPHLTIVAGKEKSKGLTLQQSGVPDDFAVDVPVCITGSHGERIKKLLRSNSEGVVIPTSRGQSAALPAPTEFLYVP